MEETKAAKDANESILAELKASRIAIAEAENKEILEARESVRAAQEETARLTGKGGGGVEHTLLYSIILSTCDGPFRE